MNIVIQFIENKSKIYSHQTHFSYLMFSLIAIYLVKKIDTKKIIYFYYLFDCTQKPLKALPRLDCWRNATIVLQTLIFRVIYNLPQSFWYIFFGNFFINFWFKTLLDMKSPKMNTWYFYLKTISTHALQSMIFLNLK